jgi:hypothetical protein
MSTSDTAGFGKFVPGFDFLQNLAKATGGADGSPSSLPNMAQWLVPSLKVEDLEKRIEELKHVQFWLDQNARALSATIQALEVQKMTMETLKGMNFTMGMPGAAQAATPKPASAPAAPPPAPAAPPPAPEPEPAADAAPKRKTKAQADASKVIDPMQLWGALTQQFQHIASTALPDAAKHSAAVVQSAKSPSKPGAAQSKAAAAKTAGKAPRKTPAAKKSAKPRRSAT